MFKGTCVWICLVAVGGGRGVGAGYPKVTTKLWVSRICI